MKLIETRNVKLEIFRDSAETVNFELFFLQVCLFNLDHQHLVLEGMNRQRKLGCIGSN